MIGKCRNPFLETKEYELLPESASESSSVPIATNKRKKTKRIASSNPFIICPEYENSELSSCTGTTAIAGNQSISNGVQSNKPHNQDRLLAAKPICSEKKGNIHVPEFNGVIRSKEKGKKQHAQEKVLQNAIQGVVENIPSWGLSESSGLPSRVEKQSGHLSLEEIGFDWSATTKDLGQHTFSTNQDSQSEDSDQEVVPVKKKRLTPAAKRAKAVEEEKRLKQKEKDLLEAEENPQCPEHFERILVGNPNSAMLWIKYMGYHAVNADIEKARAIAHRGIKRIDSHLVTEKVDLWIALLNLDHTFSPPEVFKETFAEALKCNDDYAINTRVLNLYVDSKNVTEIDQLTNTMAKKYKDKLENWLHCQNALMSVGLFEKARNLLQKALVALTKKEHVTLISRFALLENKHGFPEQAQALFENLMTTFPQRLDLLSVYVDMLVKSQSIQLARNVLERAACNTLPARKMKSIYMKWLAFEEAHGSPSDISKVETAAKKFVSKILEPRQLTNKNTKNEVDDFEEAEIKRESSDDGNASEIEDEEQDSE